LSLLFAIAAQYEGDIRWQDSAAGLREQFAHAALSCETGSDEAFREATVRSQDLADLVRGSRPEIPAAEPAVDWGLLVERPPLMRRMEQSHQDGLTKWLATPTEFRRRRDDILHEAQLLAAVAHVIGQEGFDAWDDPPYAEYATELRAAAQASSSATEAGQYDPARAALGRATKACSNCHEYYRG
jgi:hypothetical protein